MRSTVFAVLVVAGGLAPGTDDGTDPDYARHLDELKKKAPSGFAVLIERPFVVVGDEPREPLRRHAETTVRWAVRLLKQDFFEKDPPEIIDIWLFKDRESYEKHALSLFGEKPSTPYGYYSQPHRALLMNIATGGGTLVHEIVHPFMRANFPACPAWFNEGLASLYEESLEKLGHIHGATNWRLAGLQEAIRAGRLPSFEKLTSTTDTQFYGAGSGLHYAQARYLCYSLQERKLLVKFYHLFAARHEKDPTGLASLKEVLGEEELEAFQKKWEASMLELSFP
jgi:hypothetical protein